jgi:hypothetical protein
MKQRRFLWDGLPTCYWSVRPRGRNQNYLKPIRLKLLKIPAAARVAGKPNQVFDGHTSRAATPDWKDSLTPHAGSRRLFIPAS